MNMFEIERHRERKTVAINGQSLDAIGVGVVDFARTTNHVVE